MCANECKARATENRGGRVREGMVRWRHETGERERETIATVGSAILVCRCRGDNKRCLGEKAFCFS